MISKLLVDTATYLRAETKTAGVHILASLEAVLDSHLHQFLSFFHCHYLSWLRLHKEPVFNPILDFDHLLFNACIYLLIVFECFSLELVTSEVYFHPRAYELLGFLFVLHVSLRT